jgi:hypothetical protein
VDNHWRRVLLAAGKVGSFGRTYTSTVNCRCWTARAGGWYPDIADEILQGD